MQRKDRDVAAIKGKNTVIGFCHLSETLCTVTTARRSGNRFDEIIKSRIHDDTEILLCVAIPASSKMPTALNTRTSAKRAILVLSVMTSSHGHGDHIYAVDMGITSVFWVLMVLAGDCTTWVVAQTIVVF
jgi:hypothetical protein